MKKTITLMYDFLKELGGLERMMFFHAKFLRKKYDSKLLFSYVSDKEKEKIAKELELDTGIPLSQISPMKNELFQLALSLLFPGRIRKIKTDMIISYSFMSSIMAYKKKKKDGTPYIVVMCHPPNFLYTDVKGWANTPSRFFAKLLGIFFKGYLKKIDIEAVRGADKVISISEYTSKRIRDIYGVNPVIVYPQLSNFFKEMTGNEKKRFLSGKKITSPFLLAHGRIIPDKNYKSVLGMIKQIEGCDLIISGTISNEYKKELESEIIRLGLESRVKILGRIPREDLLGYYNTASLFLMPAPKEDFGLTMIEAVACGCPFVAWADGAGPNEIITKDNGLLAQPYNNADFIKKIKLALKKRWNSRKVALSVKKFSEEELGKKLLSEVSCLVK